MSECRAFAAYEAKALHLNKAKRPLKPWLSRLWTLFSTHYNRKSVGEKSEMVYLKLFWSFFQIGLFSIGGGYAAMPLIQEQVVDIHRWLDIQEFADIVTISGMTPGPIAINAATFVGTKVTGFWGAIVATMGCVLPSCIIVLTLAYFYYKYQGATLIKGILQGLRPAVVAMIASAGLSILCLALFGVGQLEFPIRQVDWWAVGIFAACFIILRKWKVNPILVMSGAGAAGIFIYRIL